MAHYWGRVAQQHGHRVTLVPPAYVRPYVRRNKTDRADAEAILEAVRSGEMPSVPVKRDRAASARRPAPRARAVDDDADGADQYAARDPARARDPAAGRRARGAAGRADDPGRGETRAAEASAPDARRASTRKSGRLRHGSRHSSASCARSPTPIPVVTRLRTIPGIGLLTATALVGTVGHIHAFRRARQFASWLGLTPREHSSGTPAPPRAASANAATSIFGACSRTVPAPCWSAAHAARRAEPTRRGCTNGRVTVQRTSRPQQSDDRRRE